MNTNHYHCYYCQNALPIGSENIYQFVKESRFLYVCEDCAITSKKYRPSRKLTKVEWCFE
jgi:hypothetical protein